MSPGFRVFAVALVLCTYLPLNGASLRGLSAATYGGSYGSGGGQGCTVGNSCRDYCGGWLHKKPLYWITSCPREYRDDQKCLNMQCVHTSVSEADTEGCFCCCGEYSVPGAVYNDCRPSKNDDDDSSSSCHNQINVNYDNNSPSYRAPSYNSPSYRAPSYNPPSRNPPSYNPPSYNPPSYGNPSYGNGANTCQQAGQNRGIQAGQMACDVVAAQCNNRAVPFVGNAPAKLPSNCGSIAVGYCTAAAQQYADRIDPGCGRALRNGFALCNGQQALFHWENTVQLMCNSML